MLLLTPGRLPRALLEPVIPWRVRVPPKPAVRVAPHLTRAEKIYFQRLAANLPEWCFSAGLRGNR